MNKNKTTKILITALIVIVWIILNALITAMRSQAGHATPGFLALILLMATIYAISAVWKKGK